MQSYDYIYQIRELLNLAHRLRTFLNNRTQEITGLSLEQAFLLCRLAASEGESTITALATGSGRTSHTVTAMVDILEREGLVVRRRNNPDDRRQVWVALTDLGTAKVQAVRQAGVELVESLFVDSLDDRTQVNLEEALRPLRALLPD